MPHKDVGEVLAVVGSPRGEKGLKYRFTKNLLQAAEEAGAEYRKKQKLRQSPVICFLRHQSGQGMERFALGVVLNTKSNRPPLTKPFHLGTFICHYTKEIGT